MPVSEKLFGTLANGEAVTLYTITNAGGSSVDISTYGGLITAIRVPDKNGQLGDVVLGFDTLADYVALNKPYIGATIGRYGNRIAKGKFTIDGVEYTLAQNNGVNHLHGGLKGFDKVNWKGAVVDEKVVLSYVSVDGEEGYPGTLSVQVSFEFSADNELEIDYNATTDKTTHVNLTNHSYFNLAGHGTILDHVVTAPIESYIPVDPTLIPTGQIAPVQDTPFDFSAGVAIGARIDQIDNGYDHNLVVNREPDSTYLEYVCDVSEPTSGRLMQVFTTEPGVQFYTGGFLDGTIPGKGGVKLPKFGGFCMETQHYPDSPNQPTFPSTLLTPDHSYTSRTVYKFSIAE